MSEQHRPVMLAEVVEALEPQRGGLYVDGTVGAGGHSAGVLEAAAPGSHIWGLDRDSNAIQLAAERLSVYGNRVKLWQVTFDRLGRCLDQEGEEGADGILLDLGVSSMQLDDPKRGFAFRFEAPLDMRMGADGPGAAELVNSLDENQLARLFRELGEEPQARRIARALVKAREAAPIETTARLASLVEEALTAGERRKRKLHPATQVFMALRLKVNDELGQLERFLQGAPSWLKPGGRLAIISYHSLEDRRVKRAMRAWADPCTCPPDLPMCACGLKPLATLPFRKAMKPKEAEVADNPRARSARLRVAVRTAETLS
jgi:16S rRNA (cytosine1402-N4)-methyltransferase